MGRSVPVVGPLDKTNRRTRLQDAVVETHEPTFDADPIVVPEIDDAVRLTIGGLKQGQGEVDGPSSKLTELHRESTGGIEVARVRADAVVRTIARRPIVVPSTKADATIDRIRKKRPDAGLIVFEHGEDTIIALDRTLSPGTPVADFIKDTFFSGDGLKKPVVFHRATSLPFHLPFEDADMATGMCTAVLAFFEDQMSIRPSRLVRGPISVDVIEGASAGIMTATKSKSVRRARKVGEAALLAFEQSNAQRLDDFDGDASSFGDGPDRTAAFIQAAMRWTVPC